MSPRILVAVSHLMGSGHLVRSLALARAAMRRGAAVRVLSGGRPLGHLDTAGVDLLQLPPLSASGLDYRRLRDARGQPAGAEYLARRREIALRALADFGPDILVTETWPFGRGALREEYAALAAAARARGARLYASVRDIPEPPSPKKAARAETALRDFDGVLVHGTPELHDIARHWRLPDRLRPSYTGLVADPLPPPIVAPEVLVAVGSGVIGRPLLAIAANASALSPRPWRLRVGGPDAAAVIAALPGPAIAEPAGPDYRARLAGAACSVSLAGYATIADLAQCATPAVIVPMAEGAEREQILRGEALAGLGLRVLDIGTLTAQTLGDMVEAEIAAGPRPSPGIAIDGADRSARILVAATRG